MDKSTNSSNLQTAEIEALEKRLKSVWQFLKQTQTTPSVDCRSKILNKLPWYLLIGSTNAGKTQLVKKSGIKLLSAQHFATDPSDESTRNKHCNFWFSETATIIDVPTNYFDIKVVPNHSLKNIQFLNALKKYTARKPLSGILIAINVADWITSPKIAQQKFADALKQTLLTTEKILHANCPLYLIFTHVDCLNGFNEFFAELGQEEREQPLGITLNSQSTTNDFKINYDRLLKRLHERVIWRLQHERNIEKRVKIQGFPLQLETLKESLANCIYQFGDVIEPHGSFILEGIYFVSNMQEGNVVDGLQKLAPVKTLTANTAANPPIKTKVASSAYFSQRLIHKIINVSSSKSQRIHLMSRKTYLLAASLTLFGIIFLSYIYYSKTTALTHSQIALAEYRESIQNLPIQDHDLNSNLLPLKHLQTAVNALEAANLPWLIAQGLNIPSLKKLTDVTYQKELTIRFLPEISKTLEQGLATEQDPTILYGLLKVYLMLGTPQNFDSTFIRNWFDNYWQQKFEDDPTFKQELSSYLNALLAKPIVPIALSSNIINQTRHKLNNVAPAQLAFAILQNQDSYNFSNPLLVENDSKNLLKKIFPTITNLSGISKIYTASQFQSVYFEQINQACLLALNGNWVIGERHVVNNISELIQAVQILYLKNYATEWQSLLNSLQIPTKQNGKQLLATLEHILDRHVPILELLNTVKINTSLPYLLTTNRKISAIDSANIQSYLIAPFAEIHHLTETLDTKELRNLKHAITLIRNLQKYVTNITDSNKKQEKAYTIAKYKFTHINQENDPIESLTVQAQLLPEPIRSWLSSLADNSWAYILNETGNYLNSRWQVEVIPEYNAHINNHYPIFKNSEKDISLVNFTHFFGPTGTIHNFYQNYLIPFVDINTATWQWRTSHNGKLNLGNEFLNQLERAAIIKTMFFNDQQQLQVKFNLRLLSMTPETEEFRFSLNEINFTDKRWHRVKHHLTWPTLDKTQFTSITFIDKAHQQHTLKYEGLWGLFKLLDVIQINAEHQSEKRFQVNFDLNGNSARYELTADNIINPFMPNIIHEFRCPTTL